MLDSINISGIDNPASNAQHRTPSIEHPASDIHVVWISPKTML
jgi:hypothetical protein